MVPTDDRPLDELNSEELRAKATELKIEGRSKLETKDELIKAIREHQEGAEDEEDAHGVHPSAEEPTDAGTARGEEGGEQPSVQASQRERVADEQDAGIPQSLPGEVGPEDEIKPGEPGPNPQRSRPVREDAEMEA